MQKEIKEYIENPQAYREVRRKNDLFTIIIALVYLLGVIVSFAILKMSIKHENVKIIVLCLMGYHLVAVVAILVLFNKFKY